MEEGKERREGGICKGAYYLNSPQRMLSMNKRTKLAIDMSQCVKK